MVEKKPSPFPHHPGVRAVDAVPGFDDLNFGYDPTLGPDIARRRALLAADIPTREEQRKMQEQADKEHAERERMLREVADAADLARRRTEFVDKLAMMLWCQWDPLNRPKTSGNATGQASYEEYLNDNARRCVVEAERLWRIRQT